MNPTQDHYMSMAPKAPHRNEPRYIIIHHSAGRDVPAKTIHQWHLDRGWHGIGYHYVVRKNGSVETGREESQSGAHAGPDYNNRSIGICVTGNFEENDPTPDQMEALAELVLSVSEGYEIPPERVLGHRDVSATLCPGERLYKQLDGLRDTVGTGHINRSPMLEIVERIQGDLAKLREMLE